MEIMEIISDSIKYPFSDFKNLIIIGVIFLVMSLCSSLGQYGNDALALIGSIISLVLVFVTSGYSLDVIKFGTELNDAMPSLDFKNNLVNGIKLLVVNIVYYIIPAIILLLVTIVVGGFGLMSLAGATISQNATPAEAISTIMTPQMIASCGIIIIVAIILAIIFGLLALMGQARLSKTGSIGNAISFGQSVEDLKTIGVGKTLGFLIVLYIMIFVIAVIFAFIGIIPIIGPIILALIGYSVLMFIQARAYGLLYSEI